MITLVLIALAPTLTFFAALPVILFALMLETCEKRTASGVLTTVEVEPPSLNLPSLRAAA